MNRLHLHHVALIIVPLQPCTNSPVVVEQPRVYIHKRDPSWRPYDAARAAHHAESEKLRNEAIRRMGKAANEGYGYLVETTQGPDDPTLETQDDPENAFDSQDHASAGGGSGDEDTLQEEEFAGVDEATRLLLKAFEDEDKR